MRYLVKEFMSRLQYSFLFTVFTGTCLPSPTLGKVKISATMHTVTAADNFPLITYEIFNAKKKGPAKHPKAIFFYIQGSEYASVLDKVSFMASAVISGGRAVMMEKRGVSHDSTNMSTFYRYDDKPTRVADNNTVINEYLKGIPQELSVILIGGSEGGDIAAAVAAGNSRVTHLILLGAGGGWSQRTEFRYMVQKYPGYLGASSVRQLDSLMASIMSSRDDSTMWAGHPYRRWKTYLDDSSIIYLKNLDIPILLIQGEADINVPAQSAREIDSAFIKMHKTNLHYVEYKDVDHTFTNVKDKKSRFSYVEIDIINWFGELGLLNDKLARIVTRRVKKAHKDIF